ASAVIEILKSIPGFELAGKHAVVIGRSIILGKPLSAALTNMDATVTLCHSKTKNLKAIAKTADVLVTGTGNEEYINDEYLKNCVVLIDCGSPKPEVSLNRVKDIASYVTPVPGGVGPITISSLLANCVKSYRLRSKQL
ncbi:bifunctional methylenetetrahydrofolate dehydrogenase/methenyltetrahydrofolate cyclohydrolase, partial [candidate division WWE3 bacterium]|nr:bifunctional methylenetetrahydrofolate dehydrogenase/methenyltetrahydrofolate cyclohydrolase [candidate division WWE3 bacterium]